VTNQRARTLALVQVLTLLVAVTLRGSALDWGAPYLYHPDEHYIVHPALNMVREGTLNPHWFMYPSLLIYAEAGIVAASHPFIAAPLTSDPAVNRVGAWDIAPAQWPYALAGRWMVVTFAVLGVWLLYRAAMSYGGAPVGVAAALFLVSAALHNESSHYLTTDVPATTLLTAALLFSVQGPAMRRLAAAGVCAGLAAATKYTAGIVLLVPLGAALAGSWRLVGRRWLVIVAAAAAGFLTTCPYAVLDCAAFGRDLLQQEQHYLAGNAAGSNWRWYLGYLYTTGLGRPLAVASAAGLIASLMLSLHCLRRVASRRSLPTIDPVGNRAAQPGPLTLVLCVVPLVYFAIVCSYAYRAERNLLLLLPFLCLLDAEVCWRAVRRVLPERAAMGGFAVVVLLIAAPGIYSCVRQNQLLARPDTRTLALEWIDANVAPGSRIAREEYTPQVSGDRYDVTYAWSLSSHDYSWYLSEKIDYLVLSSNVYGRALAPPFVAGATGAAFYTFVFQHLPQEVEIGPAADRQGPTIRVYQVPHG